MLKGWGHTRPWRGPAMRLMARTTTVFVGVAGLVLTPLVATSAFAQSRSTQPIHEGRIITSPAAAAAPQAATASDLRISGTITYAYHSTWTDVAGHHGQSDQSDSYKLSLA